jgi:hypothetical protein
VQAVFDPFGRSLHGGAFSLLGALGGSMDTVFGSTADFAVHGFLLCLMMRVCANATLRILYMMPRAAHTMRRVATHAGKTCGIQPVARIE